jgi:adenosylmethionine-8-amino-7-oxononanoate aminotransferase
MVIATRASWRRCRRRQGTLDQVIFAGYTHAPAEEVARGLIRLTDAALPSGDPLRHVFFSDSGSTAVEVGLKMALGYWHNIGAPRHKIVVMEHSYHGDTIGAMSVGARGVFNRAYAPLLFDVETIPFPEGDGRNTLDALEALCARSDKPAALIAEPLILGAGGMLVYGADVLRGMADICAAQDVLFIADEGDDRLGAARAPYSRARMPGSRPISSAPPRG